MKRLLCIAVAAVACLAISSVEVQAQQGQQGCCGYGYGYYGPNMGQGYLLGTRLYNDRIERPPYFALYPPVYYNNQIVRRPMGVSPFAAPPGVVPVEMLSAPKSAKIQNPFFDQKKATAVKDSRRNKQPNDT